MRRQAVPSILCNQRAIRQDLTGVSLLFSWQRITAGHGSRGKILEELSNASRFASTYRPVPSQRPVLGGCPPPPPPRIRVSWPHPSTGHGRRAGWCRRRSFGGVRCAGTDSVKPLAFHATWKPTFNISPISNITFHVARFLRESLNASNNRYSRLHLFSGSYGHANRSDPA